MKKNLLTALLIAAGVVATPVAHAGAIAYSSLQISDFALKFGDGAAGGGTFINPAVFAALSGSNSGDVSALLGGGAPSTATANPGFDQTNPFAGQFNLDVSQGSGWVIGGTPMVGSPTAQYSGSHADVFGNSLAANGASLTENAVSLTGSSSGTSQSNTGVDATATFTLTSAQSLQLSFGASGSIRAFLEAGQGSGAARGAFGWEMSLVDANGDVVAEWSPDGINGNGVGGTEYADGADLTRTRSAQFLGQDNTVNFTNALFEFETGLLSAGTYTLSIAQTSSADARFVPEPASLALMGLGLLGLGAMRRRKTA